MRFSYEQDLIDFQAVHLLFLTDFPGIPPSYTEFRKKSKKIRDMPENWIRGRKFLQWEKDGMMISGSQLFAAESSRFEKNSEFKNKKAGHFPNTETEVRPRTANTMPENVRQDVKTQSGRIHFTLVIANHFLLGRFRRVSLKYNGYK